MLMSTFFIFFFFTYSTFASYVSDEESNEFTRIESRKVDNFFQQDEDNFVNFMLYTRKNQKKYYLIQVENKQSISNSGFDPNKTTKILVHGWHGRYNNSCNTLLKKAYLKRYDANIIIVDWSYQSHLNYISSRYDVGKVADVIAQLIDLLVTDFKVKLSNVHIIGKSLGAHVAGIAGLKIKSGKVARVTGLDPAAPLFSVKDTDRIRPESADFVDVIHTCAYLKGFKSALGHVDFYPNGGTIGQPGCKVKDMLGGTCSHSRAQKYFAESINSNDFFGVLCNDWASFKAKKCTPPAVLMGEYTPTWARGKYYLRTNSKSPYGQGNKLY